MWTRRWLESLAGERPFPTAPLSSDAIEAALLLRELLSGDDGMVLAARLEEAGVGDELVRRLASRRRTVRIEALEALAQARLPHAFPAVAQLIRHPQPVVRFMAGRAAARTLAVWSGPEREAGVVSFAEALGRANLPAGVLGEILILLGGAAPAVLARMLAEPNLPPAPSRACLDTVGRTGLVQLAYEAGALATHQDPEVRAAALRTLGRLRRVPARARDAVIIALADDTEFVRIQAARAAAYVPEDSALIALSHSLGDQSWWVRRASAESLLERGEWGVTSLQAAAASHPDRFAMDMAAQVLRDGGYPVPEAPVGGAA
jgi:HEAT repeat protein